MSKTWKWRMNSEREKLIERAKARSRHTDKAAVVEAALRHYVESIENVEANRGDVTPAEAKRWATRDVKLIYQARTEF